MHVHSINIAPQPERAIQTIFGGLPDLPTDRWLQEAELERQGGHVALCISYSNSQSTTCRRRGSPRHAAGTLLRMLLPAVKTGVTLRLAHDRQLAIDATLAQLGLTRREVEVVRLLARRASNREIADQLLVSPHTVRHHLEKIFAKLGIHSRRSIADVFQHVTPLT